MFTLVLYAVINGKMITTRLPMPDEAACITAAVQLAPVMRPVHHECKAKKAPAGAKKAEA